MKLHPLWVSLHPLALLFAPSVLKVGIGHRYRRGPALWTSLLIIMHPLGFFLATALLVINTLPTSYQAITSAAAVTAAQCAAVTNRQVKEETQTSIFMFTLSLLVTTICVRLIEPVSSVSYLNVSYPRAAGGFFFCHHFTSVAISQYRVGLTAWNFAYLRRNIDAIYV